MAITIQSIYKGFLLLLISVPQNFGYVIYQRTSRESYWCFFFYHAKKNNCKIPPCLVSTSCFFCCHMSYRTLKVQHWSLLYPRYPRSSQASSRLGREMMATRDASFGGKKKVMMPQQWKPKRSRIIPKAYWVHIQFEGSHINIHI